MTQQNRIFFPNLDGLRFIAFSLVFLQHGFYNAFASFSGENNLLDRILNVVFLSGGTGVQIFFVLSGFLITFLLVNEIKMFGSVDLRKFYIRRTLRIWPLYFVTVFFAFILYPFFKSLIGIDSNLCSRPWYYFTFLANFDSINIARYCPGRDAMTQGIVWSVSIEEQFYVFWPLLFFLLPVSKHKFIFPFVLAACLLFRIKNEDATGSVLYFHTFAVMGDLAIGGLLAYLTIHSPKFLKFLQNLPGKAIGAIYLIIIVSYIFQDVVFVFPGSCIYVRPIFDFLWGFIILEQCIAKNNLFALGRNKIITGLGKISYGLYMLHPVGILIADIVFRTVVVKFISIQTFGSLLTMGVLSFIISIGLARISYKWLELPFLKLKDKYSILKTQGYLKSI